MVRLAFRAVVGVLAAALATGCLGGQTGQPDSLDCGASELAPTAVWSSTTVSAAAAAFEGTYAAALAWQMEPRGADTHTPVSFQDSVQLSISYGQLEANEDCNGSLVLPVSVTLTTSQSGITDSGVGTLTLVPTSQAVVGTLSYQSPQLRLNVALDEAALGQAPRGGFDAFDPTLPGASATFSEAP